MMVLSRQEIEVMYQSGAKHYDFTTILFRLIGLRMKAYRSLAIKKLLLQRGNCVIELGCGTGLNFPYLIEQIGPDGRLIGIDLTPGMLDIARVRVEQSGWKNVELIHSDTCNRRFRLHTRI
jgi:demethylmenaquinone methyltransferase/2-methoxy-6-polyprenyl-1,4-benzoquinol methylase